MIDIRKLKELVRLMVANDLSELDLRDSEEQVTLRRHSPGGPVTMVPAAAPAAVAAAPAAPPAAAPAQPDVAPPPADDALARIESPMVGTFYAQPNPESDTFVKIGDRVSPDTVVCLVEAMKIFNEIKAECSGTIEKIVPNSGDAVEFGEPLFLIKPD
ncbi:MAG: acetyl-CoA carboxylase biotin carboxyl carrier protein [Planctomycetota bacterium]|jgi:acetyl-CoA carboxylase biotin carboxyl carrier protein